MNRLAFVTTCKNRLDHLQQTLPRLVAQQPDEIVVVDYGCPQGTGDWVASTFPEVKLVRVEDDPGFCVARARNLGAAVVESEWICFIDADVLANAGWVDWMRTGLQQGFYFQCERPESTWLNDLAGTVVLQRACFERLGGYDEMIRGWGGEDSDLYQRLRFAGLKPASYPARFVESIGHGDDLRITYYPVADKMEGLLQINCYRYAKRLWMELAGLNGDLSARSREHLHALVAGAFSAWRENPAGPMPQIQFEALAGDWLPEAYRGAVRFRCTVAVELRPRRRRTGGMLARAWRRLRARLGVREPGEPSLDVQAALIRPALAHLDAHAPHAELRCEGVLGRVRPPYRLRAECVLLFPESAAGAAATASPTAGVAVQDV